MRQAPFVGATVLLTGLCVAPAAAGPVAIDDALQVVSRACADSHAAIAADGGSMVTATVQVRLAPGRFEVSAPGGSRIADAATGTYGLISDDGLRGKDRRAALRYLKRPAATHWLNAGRFEAGGQWTATFESARDAVLSLDGSCAQELGGSADPVEHNGDTWYFTGPAGTITVGLDGSGRLVQWSGGGVDRQFSYTAQDVVLPTRTVPYTGWTRASQAASLNSTMRTLSRDVAAQVNAGTPTIAAIDAAIRAGIPAGRAVPLKVRQLRRGILVYGRNPYTGTYHAWRVYLKKDTAVARRVAP